MLRTILIFLAVVFVVAGSAAGESNSAAFVFPGATSTAPSAEAALLDDAADGRLDRHAFFPAALVAGGIADPPTIEAYRRRFDHWVAELQTSGHVTGSVRDRVRAIHEFLHARVLTGGFRAASTTLGEAFENGRFNCTSSVILFRLTAERFGLSVGACEVPGHAYAEVAGEAGPIEVQTTCAAWFAAADDRAAQRNLLRSVVGDEAAAGGERRHLSDLGLLAVVYYNRGVDAVEAGRYDEALTLNRTALRLDPANRAARANLLATVNNWSLEVGRRGDVGRAVALLETGLAYAPDYDLFYENLVAMLQQRLSATTLQRATADDVAMLRRSYDRWRSELVRRGALEAADEIARRAAADPFLTP